VRLSSLRRKYQHRVLVALYCWIAGLSVGLCHNAAFPFCDTARVRACIVVATTSGFPISRVKAPCIVYESSRCIQARSSGSTTRGNERTIPSSNDLEASARELVPLSGFREARKISHSATAGFNRLPIPLISRKIVDHRWQNS
jgi:hypothetical protein